MDNIKLKFNYSTLLLLLFLLNYPTDGQAMNLLGRLGIGYTNQVVSNIDSLSMKLQKDSVNAYSALFGLDSGEGDSNYAFGFKAYRLIYDEPQLNFYSAISAIMFTYQDENDKSDSGHQLEGTFGAEFSFQGLESIGLSFEFGIGYNKYQGETSIATVGHNILRSAIHFYL